MTTEKTRRLVRLYWDLLELHVRLYCNELKLRRAERRLSSLVREAHGKSLEGDQPHRGS